MKQQPRPVAADDAEPDRAAQSQARQSQAGHSKAGHSQAGQSQAGQSQAGQSEAGRRVPGQGSGLAMARASGVPVRSLLASVALAFAVPLLGLAAYALTAGPAVSGVGPGVLAAVPAVLACVPGAAATVFAARRLSAGLARPGTVPAPVAAPPRDPAVPGPMPGFATAKGHPPPGPGGGSRQADRPAVGEHSPHAQRMEALGTLASGIVHDFGNVLQVMDGAVTEIMEEPGNRSVVERSARLLHEVIQGSRGGVRRLLTFARDDRLQAADCDVVETLTGMAEVLQRAMPKRVAIRCDIPRDLPRMRVDAGRLEAMLLNVATNAQHAMPDGGVLTLSARLHRITEAGVPASGLRLGRYVRLDVIDTGTGMSPATLARAAEPFFTTKEAGQGTGLGLYSTRSFAEQSGGAFAIASTPGHGTTVTLWLPCMAEPQALVPAPARNQAPRVLLLDDEPTIRDVLARQLRKRGLQIDVCENAAEALAAITGPQQVDLLLTDFAMPDLSCDTLVARVHVARPGLPVLVLTGYPLDANALVEAYAGTGLLELMCKPISAREIEETIRGMLDGAGAGRSSGAA